jgi:hypothetical protein
MSTYIFSNNSEGRRGEWAALVLALLLLSISSLSGCKLQDKFQGNADDSASPQTPTVTAATSALADNEVTTGFEFGNYQQVTFTLDLAAYSAQISGDYYVVKLFDADNTYYLASVTQLDSLDIAISLPLDAVSISMELYSNATSGNNSIIEEITL